MYLYYPNGIYHIMAIKSVGDLKQAVENILNTMQQNVRDLEITYTNYNEELKTWTVFANFSTDGDNYQILLTFDEEGNCTKYDLTKYSY